MAPTPAAGAGHATGTTTAASIGVGCAAAPLAMAGAGQATTDFPTDVAIKNETADYLTRLVCMPPPQPANRYRGLGWALRACDGARADELSKDYRALRT